MTRTATNVSQWGQEFQREFDRVRALIWLGIFSAWAGMAYEMIRRRLKLAGKPSAGNAAGHP
jgi:hypothetical protein